MPLLWGDEYRDAEDAPLTTGEKVGLVLLVAALLAVALVEHFAKGS